MKRLFVFLAFFPLLSYSQTLEVSPLMWDENSKLYYQEVSELEGYSANEIFSGIKKFLVSSYTNYDKVVNMEDKDLMSFAGRANTDIPFQTGLGTPASWTMWYNFQIDIKEGRYRILYNNLRADQGFDLDQYTRNALTGKELKKLQGPAKTVIPTLGDQFRRSVLEINEFITSKKNDDW